MKSVPFLISSAILGVACTQSPAPAPKPTSTIVIPVEHDYFVDGPIGKLHLSDGGSGGIPVLFLHGLGGDNDIWRAQLNHIRGFRRAIAMEARGHGQSARATEAGYTMDGLADDIDAVARGLKLERFVLVGHSIAGCALQEYAAKHADSLAGLVFVDAIGDVSHSGTPAELEAFLKSDQALNADPAKEAAEFTSMMAGAKPATKDRVLKALGEFDPKAFAPMRASMAHFVSPQDLSKTAIPLFVIESEANHSPVRFSVFQPTAPLLTLLRVSHWLMMDDPDGFNRALDGFLSAH